jgi:hypothetical protein
MEERWVVNRIKPVVWPGPFVALGRESAFPHLPCEIDGIRYDVLAAGTREACEAAMRLLEGA